MKTLTKGKRLFFTSKFFKRIINRINLAYARKNILYNPQLVIFSFDYIGLKINLEGRYENSSLNLIEKFIIENIINFKNSVALDFGANIGNHSIFLSSFFKKVYAFEPNPVTYEVLKINSKFACKNKNIITFNFGLSDKEDNLPFFIDKSNFGGSHIVSNSSKIDGLISINVKAADEIKEISNENISLIKIDIEGHELKALKGAEKILLLNKPAILLEQRSQEIRDGSSDVIDYLSSLKYKFYIIKKNFYFGENFFLRIISLILRSILGEKYSFVEVERFKKRRYDMILAFLK